MSTWSARAPPARRHAAKCRAAVAVAVAVARGAAVGAVAVAAAALRFRTASTARRRAVVVGGALLRADEAPELLRRLVDRRGLRVRAREHDAHVGGRGALPPIEPFHQRDVLDVQLVRLAKLREARRLPLLPLGELRVEPLPLRLRFRRRVVVERPEPRGEAVRLGLVERAAHLERLPGGRKVLVHLLHLRERLGGAALELAEPLGRRLERHLVRRLRLALQPLQRRRVVVLRIRERAAQALHLRQVVGLRLLRRGELDFERRRERRPPLPQRFLVADEALAVRHQLKVALLVHVELDLAGARPVCEEALVKLARALRLQRLGLGDRAAVHLRRVHLVVREADGSELGAERQRRLGGRDDGGGAEAVAKVDGEQVLRAHLFRRHRRPARPLARLVVRWDRRRRTLALPSRRRVGRRRRRGAAGRRRVVAGPAPAPPPRARAAGRRTRR